MGTVLPRYGASILEAGYRMTASDVQDLIVTTLVRHRGGTRRHWRLVVGPVRIHDRSTHAHCNWSVAPDGDVFENDAVERMLDTVRLEHPIVEAG